MEDKELFVRKRLALITRARSRNLGWQWIANSLNRWSEPPSPLTAEDVEKIYMKFRGDKA